MQRKRLLNWYLLWFQWHQYLSVLRHFKHQEDLEGLATWATRKRLPVVHYYKERLIETQNALLLNKVRFPGIFFLAEITYHLWVSIKPVRKFYPKGYASKYQLSRRPG